MMPTRSDPLNTSILATVGAYCTAQIAAFCVIAVCYTFPILFFLAYCLTQVVFLAVLAVFLLLSRSFFYSVETGTPLRRVNLANKITLLRISMLPTLLFLILAANQYPVVPVLLPTVALTFLTDMIDGSVSRATHQVTHIGKILDSVSDYSLLIVVAIAYYRFGLLPDWLFWLILFRLVFQAFGMGTMLLIHGQIEPKPTIFGKVAVATLMTLFAGEPLKLLFPSHIGTPMRWFEAIAGIVVAISVVDKGFFFWKEISRRNAQIKEEP